MLLLVIQKTIVYNLCGENMLIYIVRHGETNMNKARIFQGTFDEPLNEDGIRLAEISGKALKGIHFDEAFTSPLSRSSKTIEILLKESGNETTPVHIENRIQEVNVGDWTLNHLDDKSNPEYEKIHQFFKDPFSVLDVPNGENVYDVIKRTQDFIKELASRNDNKTYLVGTHGFAMRCLLNMFYEDKKDFWHKHVPYNCCFNILEVKNNNISLIKEDVCFYDKDSVVDYYK